MIDAIITKLNTGSITNNAKFGDDKQFGPPYNVVKAETRAGGVRSFLIISHFPAGEQNELEDYIFGELSDLLKDAILVDRHGNTFKLKDSDEYTDIVTSNDDSTISMERVFYVPLRLH